MDPYDCDDINAVYMGKGFSCNDSNIVGGCSLKGIIKGNKIAVQRQDGVSAFNFEIALPGCFVIQDTEIFDIKCGSSWCNDSIMEIHAKYVVSSHTIRMDSFDDLSFWIECVIPVDLVVAVKITPSYRALGMTHISLVTVDDEEHAILNPDSLTSFEFRGHLYTSVMQAYNTAADESALYDILLQRSVQDSLFRTVLLSTTGFIVHKSSNQFLGTRVPEFDGQNLMGKFLVNLRDELQHGSWSL